MLPVDCGPVEQRGKPETVIRQYRDVSDDGRPFRDPSGLRDRDDDRPRLTSPSSSWMSVRNGKSLRILKILMLWMTILTWNSRNFGSETLIWNEM